MSVTQMFSRGRPSFYQQAEAGQRRRAGAGHDQLHLVDLLADQRQAVEDGRADDDRGAVLVVVEDRDLHALAQLLLDVEALRRLDVLEIDAAEGRLQRGDDLDQLVRVELVELDVEDVDAGELLEQDGLAFHHRLGGERADGAQAQHGRAVGDHADQVGARGQLGGRRRIAHDLVAGGGDAGRIGERRGRAGWPAAWSGRPRSFPAGGGDGSGARCRSVHPPSPPPASPSDKKGRLGGPASAQSTFSIDPASWCGQEDSNFHASRH